MSFINVISTACNFWLQVQISGNTSKNHNNYKPVRHFKVLEEHHFELYNCYDSGGLQVQISVKYTPKIHNNNFKPHNN